MAGYIGSLAKYVISFMFISLIVVIGMLMVRTNTINGYQHHVNMILQSNGSFNETKRCPYNDLSIKEVDKDYGNKFYITPKNPQKRYTYGQPMKYTVHTDIPVFHTFGVGAGTQLPDLQTQIDGTTQSQTGNQ